MMATKIPQSKWQKISLKCKRKIAYNSLDHVAPLGTRQDNSSNHLFNEKLYRLYGYKQITLLDIGCSGGRLVKETIDDGHIAVGLEGSDYSKRFHRAEWRTIPEFLFTCDVTKPFSLYIYPPKRPMLFNVVTAWEFMEHIEKKDLAPLIHNVKKHMASDCIWVMSIANCPSIYNGIDLHRTKESKEWWVSKLREFGLINVNGYVEYFNTQFVRGKYETSGSFHLVVCKDPSQLPEIPKVDIVHWLWDRWIGSKTQVKLRMLLIGK